MAKTEKVKRVYLDNASATPVDPLVKDAMAPFWSRGFGNPGAVYKEGVIAKKAIENSRREIAGVLKCRTNEIIFVNGATESLNLAIRGAIGAWKKTNKNRRPEIITTSIEHEAVLDTCRALEKEGVKIVYVKPDEKGIVNAKKIAELLNENTVIVSVMYANNEIGTIEPIKEIGRAIRLFKLARTIDYRLKTKDYPLFHTDAVQAANYLSLDVNSLGVNLLTINAAKIYGPKGTAILYVKDKTPIEPILYGGGQEKELRPGTENVPLIAGLAKALSITRGMCQKESRRLSALRDYFIKQLLRLPAVGLNGDTLNRLPNNVNVSIGGIDNEYFVIQLDEAGIACSTRSTCNTGSDRGSHVILALGKSEKEASESVRFTLGRFTTKKDIDYTLRTIRRLLNV
ncbi:MAG: cysteine desulfurase family protein [Patescibacteria group bacterium]